MHGNPIPGEFDRLDPRVVPYERVGRLIRGAVLIVVVLVLGALAVRNAWFPTPVRVLLLALAALSVVLQILGTIYMPRFVHRCTGYQVNDQGLEIRRGVLWRSIVTVARSRVQHLDVTQGPLERRYGLGSLAVHTAGTHDATIVLGGVAHETALAIRDELGAWSEDADGV